MTYETIAKIAQQGGSVYFFLVFLGGVIYACLPRNREEFDRAARLPLDEDN
jgi:cytochrome c oxidase cbb3-type subunit IV